MPAVGSSANAEADLSDSLRRRSTERTACAPCPPDEAHRATQGRQPTLRIGKAGVSMLDIGGSLQGIFRAAPAVIAPHGTDQSSSRSWESPDLLVFQQNILQHPLALRG